MRRSWSITCCSAVIGVMGRADISRPDYFYIFFIMNVNLYCHYLTIVLVMLPSFFLLIVMAIYTVAHLSC